jgi:hypothetical protein
MIDAGLADVGTFIITLIPSVYHAWYQGTYTIDISYQWYVPTLIVTRSFTWTLLDPCPSAVTTPTTFANLNLVLGSADTPQIISDAVSIT